MGVGDKFSGFVVGLDALSKGLGGVGVNAQAVTARITALYQGFVGLSVVTNTTGKEMDALAFRTLQIAKQMGYTQESVIAMQKTLMVGFQKPIHDVDTFNNLLARSEQLFGRNEESASRLIDTLARQSKEMSSLRDLTLEISNIEGRAFKEKRQLNAEELKTTGAAREASEATLKAKFEAGEINAEQFSTSMSMHRREKDIQGEILEGGKNLNKIRQENLAAQVAMDNAMFKMSGNKVVQVGLEYMTTGGSQLAAKGIDYASKGFEYATSESPQVDEKALSITDQLGRYEDTRKAVGNTSVGTDQQKVLKSFAADVVKDTGAANATAAIEELNKKLKEKNILQDLSEEDLKKEVALMLQSEEVNKALTANKARLNSSTNDQNGKLEKTLSLEGGVQQTLIRANALRQTMLDNTNAQVTALNASIGALSAINTLSGLAGRPIDASKYGLDPKKMISDAAAAQSAYDAIATRLEAKAANAKTMNDNASKSQESLSKDAITLAEDSALLIIDIEKALALEKDDVRRKSLEASKQAAQAEADQYRSLAKRADKGDPDAQKELYSKISSGGKAGPEADANAAKARQRSAEISLSLGQQLIQAVTAGDEQRLKNLDLEFQKMQAQVSLMDSFAVGIGANAAARQQAAQKLIEQARVLSGQEEKVAALKAEYQAKEASAVTPEAKQAAAAQVQAAENKINEIQTKRIGITKQALDMTQKLREGYLDAIQAMESGAGVFTEIVVNQDKNLGSLIRTTAEVPRVLRTGAGSGGLTQPTGFGPGGMTGGADPRSEEYGKSVLTNFEQVNQLMAELPKLIGEETGKNLAIAASARPEYGSVILDGTSPGSAGTVTVGGGSTSPGSAGKASPEISAEAAKFSKQIAEISAEVAKFRQLAIENKLQDKASPGSADKALAEAEADASKLRQQAVEISLQGKASPGSADKALAEASAEASAETEKFRQQVIEIRLQDKASNLRQQPEVALNTQQQLINQSGKAGSVTVETAAIAETITKGIVAAVEIGVRNALSVLEQKTA